MQVMDMSYERIKDCFPSSNSVMAFFLGFGSGYIKYIQY